MAQLTTGALFACLATASLAAMASLAATASLAAPLADHHVHLRSERASALLAAHTPPSAEPPAVEPHDAAEIVATLDRAGIGQAVVISDAYRLGAPDLRIADEADEVRRENDWTAAQAAVFPDRLVGFCSVNPLKDYALDVLTACKASGLKGLKLHLANADMDLADPDQRAHLKRVVARAGELGMPMLLHLRNSDVWDPRQAVELLVYDLLPAAGGVPIQLAHVGGWGGFDGGTQQAMERLAEICAARPRLCRRLFFDLAALIDEEPLPAPTASVLDAPGDLAVLTRDMRRIGLSHFVFGSDFPFGDPAIDPELLTQRLLLSPAEAERLWTNRAPWLTPPARHR